MDSKTLLQLTPELLAKALMHRHERLIEELPETIRQHQGDLDFTKPQAETARNQRDDLNTKVASLKDERDTCTAKASALRTTASKVREKLLEEGKLRNPNPKWAREKLDAQLKQLEFELETEAGDHKREQKILRKMKDLQVEHESWVQGNASKIPELKEYYELEQEMRKLYEQAQKAHQAMLELVEENEELHKSFMVKEVARRTAASQLSRSTRTFDISNSAIDKWNDYLTHGFDDLLVDAKRISDGGMSTIAISRQKKREREASMAAKSKSQEEE